MVLSQLSVVHALLSSHTGAGPPTHTLFAQVSWVVQALLSVHGAVLLVVTQPLAESQLSLVHGFLSSHTVGAPDLHAPAAQMSPVVHASPSLQTAVLLAWAQPVLLAQLSVVQTFLSSQLVGAGPLHAAPEQMSPVVHASPSSQAAVLFVCTQPLVASQLSSVQGFLSSQLMVAPPHLVAAQMSPVVQALLSLHCAVLAVCKQPSLLLHRSVVHRLLSSQLMVPGLAPQLPAPQTALSWNRLLLQLETVHAVPSAAFLWPQPLTESQVSTVQGLPSSQLMPPEPLHTPAVHMSLALHELPSLHTVPSVTFLYWQPSLPSQVSLVHTLLSLQSTAAPLHLPAAQVSLVVHTVPSSHAAVLLAWAQPVLLAQVSSVHTVLSLQSVGFDWVHAPPKQVSPVVQASPSSHTATLLVWLQPAVAEQASSVQGFLSSQSAGGAIGVQVPDLQSEPWSCLPLTQLGSMHTVLSVATVVVQPMAGSQASLVQSLPSLQTTAAPGTQPPFLQASPLVQAVPSSHGAVLLVLLQPLAGSQTSMVQPLPSSQLVLVPGRQKPTKQVDGS